MLVTTIWLLFISQSFAKDLAPYAHHHIRSENVENSTPMDYFDSIHLPNPHYKINYIYEQRRTDEDPQVEQIEEEIGKYMHFQPSSTSTTTEPQQNINDNNENFKEVTNHGPFETPLIVPETHHENHKHNEATSTLAPMPPAPKLRESKNEAHLHIPTINSDNGNDYQTALPVKVPSPPIIQWVELQEEPISDISGFYLDRPHVPAHESKPTSHRHPKHRLRVSPTTSEAPVEIETQKNHASTEKHIYLSPTTHAPEVQLSDKIKYGFSSKVPPRQLYRGRYRFSWDDMNDMHTSSVPKASELKKNPIPAVPTLSPWYDGYGK